MSGASRGFLTRVVPSGTVQLFTDEAQAVSKAAAPFDWGEVQGINVHGVWIMTWACGLRVIGKVRVCVLGSWSLVHQSDFLGDLPLEMEVGSLFVPADDGSGTLSIAWTRCISRPGFLSRSKRWEWRRLWFHCIWHERRSV